MNIIRRELRSSWINMIVWFLAFFFMAYASIIKFDSILISAPEVKSMLDQMPRIIKALFNMVDLDVTKLPGYFAVVSNFLLVMAASHGLFLGIRLFAKEEQNKTAEFLMTKPRSRRDVFLSKVAAGIIIMGILQVVLFICNRSALASHLPGAKDLLKNYTVVYGVVHLLFFSLGVFLINMLPRGRAESVGLILLLMNYFIPVIINMSEALYEMKEFLPFHMFLKESMAQMGGLQVMKLLILLVLSIAFFIIGQRRFDKKDIYI